MEVRDCTESHELQILSMKFEGLKIVRSSRVYDRLQSNRKLLLSALDNV